MKKRIGVLLGILLTLSACGQEEVFDETVFLQEVQPHVNCLDSCLQEMFCADVDFTEEYYCLYENEESYADGEGEIVMMAAPQEAMQQTEYFLDPTYGSCYPVENFNSNAEVRQYLQTFLAAPVIDQFFQNDFVEFDEELYLFRGARGYGAVSCDPESLQYVGEKDRKQYAEIDFLLFDAYDYTTTLVFEQVGEGWLLTEVVEPAME